MTLAPRDYITERRKEITARIQQLNAELSELDRMESALGLGIPPLDGTVEIPPMGPTAVPVKALKRNHIPGGIKNAILAVLVHQYDKAGATAQEILAAIKARHGVDLPRTSLSPQLSRLKNDKLVIVENGVWKTTPDGQFSYLMGE